MLNCLFMQIICIIVFIIMRPEDYTLDERSIEITHEIIKETAENLVRWYFTHQNEDHEVQLLRLIHTIQIVTIQKTYELIGKNGRATARLLHCTYNAMDRAVKRGKIDVG